jgi:hypothetical protein
MQEARVYLELVRERGTKRLPLTRVYRQLFNREWYLIAYGKIYQIWIAIPLTPFDPLLNTL